MLWSQINFRNTVCLPMAASNVPFAAVVVRFGAGLHDTASKNIDVRPVMGRASSTDGVSGYSGSYGVR